MNKYVVTIAIPVEASSEDAVRALIQSDLHEFLQIIPIDDYILEIRDAGHIDDDNEEEDNEDGRFIK